jgi:hypothetical protein
MYRNMGDGTFASVNTALPGLSDNSVSAGDFDNDGKIDLLLTGRDANYQLVSQIWRNLGNWVFSNINAGLPGVGLGSATLTDLDGDGWLDIVLAGYGDFQSVFQVLHNLGNGSFVNANPEFPQGPFADFDNDGRLDIFTYGAISNSLFAQVWRNLGEGSYSNSSQFPQYVARQPAIGDFDNNGAADIFLTAPYDTNLFAYIWQNSGNAIFAPFNAAIPAIYWGESSAIADFDNDGKLDLLLTGHDYRQNVVAGVWRNFAPATNHLPAAPTSLAVLQTRSGIRLAWNPGTDFETPSGGLSYNVRVGTVPGGSDILASNSETNGLRRLVQAGNAGPRHWSILTNLVVGRTYYWSVQSIDSAFAGSPFAPEATFVLRPWFNRWSRRSDGAFQAEFDIEAGLDYTIQASDDLVHWFDLMTFNFGESVPVLFTDPQATNSPARFYRFSGDWLNP